MEVKDALTQQEKVKTHPKVEADRWVLFQFDLEGNKPSSKPIVLTKCSHHLVFITYISKLITNDEREELI
jgi:hypothetical protein